VTLDVRESGVTLNVRVSGLMLNVRGKWCDVGCQRQVGVALQSEKQVL